MNPEHVQELSVTIGVITVSSSRDFNTDSSGKTITSLFEEAGFKVKYYEIVPDIVPDIRKAVTIGLELCNCLVLNGGTGLTHDDCTIEAIEPLYEKKIDGFGELFRMKSFEEIGTSAMLSRASAGIVREKAIFCIPGSNAAVKLATRSLIIPEITHILSHARK